VAAGVLLGAWAPSFFRARFYARFDIGCAGAAFAFAYSSI
jgi:hypothetical protein